MWRGQLTSELPMLFAVDFHVSDSTSWSHDFTTYCSARSCSRPTPAGALVQPVGHVWVVHFVGDVSYCGVTTGRPWPTSFDPVGRRGRPGACGTLAAVSENLIERCCSAVAGGHRSRRLSVPCSR